MLPFCRAQRIAFVLIGLSVCLQFAVTPIARAQIRDGGIDPHNLGKGDWIYILANAVNHLGGPVSGVTNLTSLIAYEKNQGVQYIIIKAGDGATRFPSDANPQFTSDVVNAGHAAGVKIFGYGFSYGTDVPGEQAIADYVFNLGADGFVFDAEGAWESQNLPNNTALAIQLCSGIRTNWPNKFLAHSPFPIISFHSTFPYKEFGYYCDVVMPQDYWNDIGSYVSSSPTIMVQKMTTEYRNWQNSLTGIWTNSIKPIVPVGQGWSDGTNYTTTAAQITEFYNALKTDPNPATSGGYKGVNWWRAELHPSDVLAAIRTNSIGNVSTNAPIIANISAGNLTDTSATITWTTDQSSDSVVEYGFNTGYGSAVTNTTSLYFHSVTISGLSPNTTYHFRVKSKNAFNQQGVSSDYVLTTLLVPVPDILVDDGSVGYSGSWTVGSSSGFSGTEYRFASTTVSTTLTATFRPTINTSGNYDIYIWYIAGSNRATNAPYTISGNGAPLNVAVNQSINGGTWFKIASAQNFAAGTSGFVQVANGTGASGKVVIADAVKFVFVPPPPSPPAIDTQPQNLAVNQGNSATFTVVASGTAPLNYQWRFNGANIAGATASTYTKNNAQPNDAGNYSVVITNSVNSITSSIAVLTVNLPPFISSQPQSVTTNSGTDVTFTVAAGGTAPLSYFWQFNGAVIPGATTTAYTRTNVQAADAGVYLVIVSNVAGTTISDAATLALTTQSTPPHLDAIALLPDGTIHLEMSGGPGNFGLEVAPGLSGWTQLASITATNVVFEYVDSESNQPSRFYRLRVLP
jgi:hypothetical protein